MNTLEHYGWQSFYDSQMMKKENFFPCRIISDRGEYFHAITSNGERKLKRPLDTATNLTVGDWVLAYSDEYDERKIIFHQLLPRKTKLSRLAAGIEVKEQMLAANIDTVFLIQSLNHDFNMRRLERYLIATWESGALPVVVLTKSDLCNDTEEKKMLVEQIAIGVEVHTISNLTSDGIGTLKKYFTPGKTVALLGSSGVGKSSLVNNLIGSSVSLVNEVRLDDSKGRHTTTHRELLLLPDGGMIIDTPGMRSLALWEAQEGMDHMFSEIENAVKMCKFTNCSHQKEPGCAIQAGLRSGEIDKNRLGNWRKLQNELRHLESKKKHKERITQKKIGKASSKSIKAKLKSEFEY